MLKILVFFLFIYLIYRGIMFLFKIFSVINTSSQSGNNVNKDNVSSSAKSKFKDVEEANYTEIKDDNPKDPQ